MHRSLAFGALLLVIAGCKSKAATTETVDAAPKEEALIGTDGVDLAISTAATKAVTNPTEHVVAYDATHGLVLDGKVILAPATVPAQGFDAKDKVHGQNDLTITALQTAIRPPSYKHVLVGFEAATPYRVVAEVLFTLTESDISTFDFLVRTASGERRIFTNAPPKAGEPDPCRKPVFSSKDDGPIMTPEAERMQMEMLAAFGAGDSGLAYRDGAMAPQPTVAPPPPPVVPLADRRALCLSVEASKSGIVVRWTGDRLDSTCAKVAADGTATTLPASDGKLPLAAATACAKAVHAQFPVSAGARVTVAASGETPWRDVVALLDLFGPSSGFGEPGLGIGR